ncbi:hypothetical protein Pelo_2470 [Pelomyxa schiedti]|nr:hypothetical protein Pelo_2470 [Pelomyxa schiedti]
MRQLQELYEQMARDNFASNPSFVEQLSQIERTFGPILNKSPPCAQNRESGNSQPTANDLAKTPTDNELTTTPAPDSSLPSSTNPHCPKGGTMGATCKKCLSQPSCNSKPEGAYGNASVVSEKPHVEATCKTLCNHTHEYWGELQQVVQQVYRESSIVSREAFAPYSHRVSELITYLCDTDPILLYNKLEAEGVAWMHNIRCNLRQFLSTCTPLRHKTATEFIALLDKHFTNLQSAVDLLQGVLTPLQSCLLDKFSTNFADVNKALFYEIVYVDPVIQTALPEVRTLLKRVYKLPGTDVFYYSRYEPELQYLAEKWRSTNEAIKSYSLSTLVRPSKSFPASNLDTTGLSEEPVPCSGDDEEDGNFDDTCNLDTEANANMLLHSAEQVTGQETSPPLTRPPCTPMAAAVIHVSVEPTTGIAQLHAFKQKAISDELSAALAAAFSPDAFIAHYSTKGKPVDPTAQLPSNHSESKLQPDMCQRMVAEGRPGTLTSADTYSNAYFITPPHGIPEPLSDYESGESGDDLAESNADEKESEGSYDEAFPETKDDSCPCRSASTESEQQDEGDPNLSSESPALTQIDDALPERHHKSAGAQPPNGPCKRCNSLSCAYCALSEVASPYHLARDKLRLKLKGIKERKHKGLTIQGQSQSRLQDHRPVNQLVEFIEGKNNPGSLNSANSTRSQHPKTKKGKATTISNTKPLKNDTKPRNKVLEFPITNKDLEAQTPPRQSRPSPSRHQTTSTAPVPPSTQFQIRKQAPKTQQLPQHNHQHPQQQQQQQPKAAANEENREQEPETPTEEITANTTESPPQGTTSATNTSHQSQSISTPKTKNHTGKKPYHRTGTSSPKDEVAIPTAKSPVPDDADENDTGETEEDREVDAFRLTLENCSKHAPKKKYKPNPLWSEALVNMCKNSLNTTSTTPVASPVPRQNKTSKKKEKQGKRV